MFLFKERREIGTTAAFEMELPLSPITFHQHSRGAAKGLATPTLAGRNWSESNRQNQDDAVQTLSTRGPGFGGY